MIGRVKVVVKENPITGILMSDKHAFAVYYINQDHFRYKSYVFICVFHTRHSSYTLIPKKTDFIP